MKDDTLESVRDIEKRLTYANPKESAKLAKELVRRKSNWIEK